MDHKMYYDSIDRMEKLGVSPEYIQGWIGGFMANPKREEQRITEAYEAGYEDGGNGTSDGCEKWVDH